MTTAQEGTLLLQPAAVASAASAGAIIVNQATERVRAARTEGPLTFRMMGLLGGLAMIVSNLIAILDRFFSFNFTGALIAVYGTAFGIVIALIEAPGSFGGGIKAGIHYYAAFLQFTWGRGALYFFVGSLQVSNINMLDWAVGGFMIFVGLTALFVGIAAGRDLRLLKHSLQTEEDLRSAWKKHDSDGNGFLDIKELTSFIKSANVDMTRNEVAAAFLALGMMYAM
jgi:COPI associated protein/EF-hand domain